MILHNCVLNEPQTSTHMHLEVTSYGATIPGGFMAAGAQTACGEVNMQNLANICDRVIAIPGMAA